MEVLAVFCLLVVSTLAAQKDPRVKRIGKHFRYIPKKDTVFRQCGRQLAKTISVICQIEMINFFAMNIHLPGYRRMYTSEFLCEFVYNFFF